MPVPVLLIVLIVLFVGLLLAADRVVKLIKRGLRRKEANRRLAAAASTALTSVMPTIHDHAPRHVD